MINLTINDIQVSVPEGSTILEAAQTAKIKIPTLCYLKDVQQIGACRMCVVEVEGARTLVASCVAPATEGMKVHTNTKRVRDSRKFVMELIMSDHDGDCLTCIRNNNCELQTLAHELGVKDIPYEGEKSKKIIDESTPALVRDSSKCILCRRCVSACNAVESVGAIFNQFRGFESVVGPAFGQGLDTVACIQCGQCSAMCPVGAISEKDETAKVWDALDDPNKFVVVQTAPAIRAALGDCFDNEPGTLVTKKMFTALRRLGFDAVFDTNFTADLTIMEEGNELLTRLTKALRDKEEVNLPLFTSCCPAWIKFAEYFYPEYLNHISTCKSPQQMFGTAAKTYYSKTIAKHPRDIVVVSIMPCIAKKFEAQREEMADSWSQDVDIALTTRELGRMIKQAGMDFDSLPEGNTDLAMGQSSGAADMFASTGGVMEAALRTAYEVITGEVLPFEGLHVQPIEGLEGIKEASITFDTTLPEWDFLKGVTLNVAVAHQLANARELIEKIKAGQADYHFVEVMTCEGGCIGGAGQPRPTDNEVRIARMNAILKEDEGKEIRKSHENPEVAAAYERFFGQPLSETSHKFLHTHYKPRKRV